jgi:hypothetical protein
MMQKEGFGIRFVLENTPLGELLRNMPNIFLPNKDWILPSVRLVDFKNLGIKQYLPYAAL